ncbi:hypothetical protein H0H93_010605 [Arthromyces matolae]|nr:hypothetical protein H0H93_010605 [Arthromyces matolae]
MLPRWRVIQAFEDPKRRGKAVEADERNENSNMGWRTTSFHRNIVNTTDTAKSYDSLRALLARRIAETSTGMSGTRIAIRVLLT